MGQRLNPGVPRRPWRARRWPARLGIVAIVLALHGWVAQGIGRHLADWRMAADMPKRIEVAYVREMALELPPAVQAAPPPPPKRSRAPRRVAAAAPAVPASAPQEAPVPGIAAQSAIAATAPTVADATPAAENAPAPAAASSVASADAASAVPVAAASAAAPAASAPASPGFAWPRSTRLSYVLTGNYRGELHGTAQVEWIKAGSRYQVHLDAVIGLPIAPLFTRRMSSEGRLVDDGLAPERFDQDSKMALRDRLRETLRFGGNGVWLANGQRREGWTGVQDAASQFVQLSFLFNTQPQLRAPGSEIAFPLALPRHVLPWVYEVGEHEPLSTSFGEIDTFHVKPKGTAPPGNLTAEMWVAPALRYLPVRIRLRQDEATFIDLVISRKPELAAE